jgi:hypothetical protein
MSGWVLACGLETFRSSPSHFAQNLLERAKRAIFKLSEHDSPIHFKP